MTVKAPIYEQNLYDKLHKYNCWSKPLNMVVLVDRKHIHL